MNYNTVKRPDKRFRTSYSASLKLQLYGNDNLYPQRMDDLLANSPTGSTCYERYRTFVEGNGLYDDDLAFYVCNRLGDTVDDVYRLIARDMTRYGGFAVHVTYNLKCEITELQHVPFQSTRLAEEDDAGRVPYIMVHPDWESRKTRRGKTITVTAKNVQQYYPFNPRKDVVMSQILADGSIEAYRGQILWVSLAGRNEYPKPVHDKVTTELSVDEGISNVKYRNVRNNFLLSGMIVRKKGAMMGMDDEGNPVLVDEDDNDFMESLEDFQGDVNACSLMDVTVNQEEDAPKFVSVEGPNFDRKFQITESSTVERIYAAYGQEPWYCVRVGKVGFSGDVLREAYEYYNSYVEPERRIISRNLKRIFGSWFEHITDDYTIEPLVYQYNYANGNLDETQQQNGKNGTHNNGGGGS